MKPSNELSSPKNFKIQFNIIQIYFAFLQTLCFTIRPAELHLNAFNQKFKKPENLGDPMEPVQLQEINFLFSLTDSMDSSIDSLKGSIKSFTNSLPSVTTNH